MKNNRQREAGFTLIELMIVMAIIGVLATLRFPALCPRSNSAGSCAERDLQTMRAAIDSYTMDKQKAPQALDDLVQEGYLRRSRGSMTHSKDTWVADTSDAMYSIDQTEPGITDVHSGSEDTGSDDQPYSLGNSQLPITAKLSIEVRGHAEDSHARTIRVDNRSLHLPACTGL